MRFEPKKQNILYYDSRCNSWSNKLKMTIYNTSDITVLCLFYLPQELWNGFLWWLPITIILFINYIICHSTLNSYQVLKFRTIERWAIAIHTFLPGLKIAILLKWIVSVNHINTECSVIEYSITRDWLKDYFGYCPLVGVVLQDGYCCAAYESITSIDHR